MRKQRICCICNPTSYFLISLILVLLLLTQVSTDHAHAKDSINLSNTYEKIRDKDSSFGEDLYAQASDQGENQSGQSYETGYYGTRDWQVFAAVYLWLTGMNGEAGIGPAVADVDVSFGDIFSNLDFGIQGHLELWWKKWIFFVDPIYMKVSSKSSQTRVIGSTRSKVEVEMFLMDLAAGYRVADVALSENTKSNNLKSWPAMTVDLYGGGRILTVNTEINFTIDTPMGTVGQRVKEDQTWFDFIVGTRLIFDFTENLLLTIKTDIGGFGLGFSSDVDWNFVSNIGYTLPWWGVTPYIGYRVLYIDYEDGSGSNKFTYNIWHTGPQIGLGVRF
ncbi:MAG: hypothetical protein AAF462_06345 [Thermodesulfobacteriota bacterium]